MAATHKSEPWGLTDEDLFVVDGRPVPEEVEGEGRESLGLVAIDQKALHQPREQNLYCSGQEAAPLASSFRTSSNSSKLPSKIS